MKKSEFDKFAGDYREIHNKNLKLSGYKSNYFAAQKIKIISDYDDNDENRKIKFLNFGCGDGAAEKYIRNFFPTASIFSTDISEESIKKASVSNKEIKDIRFEHFDGKNLPFAEKFDIILIANVLHHIDRQEHISTLKLIRSSMHRHSQLFIFEHNNKNPGTRYLFNTCEFDKNCTMLPVFYTKEILNKAGFKLLNLRYINFFPKQLGFLNVFENLFGGIPLGAQYFIIASKL